MVSDEALREHFDAMGCAVKETAVLQKCMDLCDLYNLDEETFVDKWIAFALLRFKTIDLTLDGLGMMERVELKRVDRKVPEARLEQDLSKLAVYSPHATKDEGENILEMYGGKHLNTPKAKRLRSPESEQGEQDSKVRAIGETLSPSTYTLKTGTPSRRPVRVGTRILVSIGQEVTSWKCGSAQKVEVQKTEDPHVPSNSMYMFELITRKGEILTRVCWDVGQRLCGHWQKLKGDDMQSTWNVTLKSQMAFRTWGRICCEREGKLNVASILLEGAKSPNTVKGIPIIKLDLSSIPQYSVFRGQVVAVEGCNPTGNVLVAKEMFVESFAPFPKSPYLKENVTIFVAAGPFTMSGDLDYQPLTDLLQSVMENEPNVLILVGPFVDFSHPEIRSPSITLTFQEFFEKIVGRIMDAVKGLCTQVVLIPSHRDAHHHPVYPTPEFALFGPRYPNLHLMPDPSMLNIEGLIMGVTAVDVFMHLGREEFSANASGINKLNRLATHILDQKCFYPLNPPALEVNLDTHLWEKYAFMYQQPHILILPSDMRYFCKCLNNSVVINPERLCKHTYARLNVRPVSGGAWTTDNVSCEIIKI
ncbi:DNA polymerase alpha subunit B [Orussus abietinus]|uniref:DNA polymerase alpha subunit B n=1 Tax=Orussus abietinus TaxID=222816 RepID=UPI00062534E8|nr:DNA polymerase alpha subunit B [Orussus abietinus]